MAHGRQTRAIPGTKNSTEESAPVTSAAKITPTKGKERKEDKRSGIQSELRGKLYSKGKDKKGNSTEQRVMAEGVKISSEYLS